MINWKGYKAVPPKETIHRIKRILEYNGIDTKCITFGKEEICRSARVVLAANNLLTLNIGTNGKGIDENYASASAYAELMERLQNKMLVFTTKYASPLFRKNNPALADNFPGLLSFRYFPDEEYRRIDEYELCRLGCRFLPGNILFKDCSNNQYYDMPFLPFYNFNRDEIEYIPYDLIRFAAGSTGLCAGNTPEEAILQGINEIFERYVLQQIYIRHPRFPKIDISLFKDTAIWEILMRLKESTNWKFEIMDCSLEGMFPVIGLYISDPTDNSYTFRLGADNNPVIALSRCLTEIFQGTDINKSSFIPISGMNSNWFASNEYRKNLINGRGQFPKEVFLSENTTDLSKWHKQYSSIEENFKSTVHWLLINGYTLYVRDNSFLSFPAYHVYIPGLSDVNHNLYNIRADLKPAEHYYEVMPEYRIKKLSKQEIKSFESKYRDNTGSYIPLFDYSSAKYNKINKHLLQALLLFKIHDSNAWLFMSEFLNAMETRGTKLGDYYYCLRDFMHCFNDCKIEDIRQILIGKYSENTVEEVISVIPEHILDNLPLPECFNCSSCPIKHECLYDQVIKFEASVQKVQILKPINQSHLKNLNKK